jgi:hypothetical protein
MHMNLEQMTDLKATLSSVTDILAVELVRLSDLRKQVLVALAEAESIIDEEVNAHTVPTPTVDVVVPDELPPAVAFVADPPYETKKTKPPTVSVQKETKKAPKKARKAKAAPKAAPVAAAPTTSTIPDGVIPTLKRALVEVMGTDVVNVDEALKRLRDKGWAPNAQDAKGVVAHRLSQTKNLFERDHASGRGFYRVRPDAPVPTLPKTRLAAAAGGETKAKKAKAAKPVAKKAAPAKKNGAAKAEPKVEAKTDEAILKEMGIRPEAVSPFKA